MTIEKTLEADPERAGPGTPKKPGLGERSRDAHAAPQAATGAGASAEASAAHEPSAAGSRTSHAPHVGPRHSHVPAAGTLAAAEVERARTEMLSDCAGSDAHAHRRRRRVRGAHPPGRRRHVRLPGRRRPAALRRARRVPADPPRPGSPRAGRCPRCRWVRPCLRSSRRLPRHFGARRHEPCHRARHRAARLGSDRRGHRERRRRAARQGRLPGDRHHRHHAADDQAQLPRPECRRPAAGLRRGLPHRANRPPGPRPHRHHQGRADGRDPRDPPGHRRPAGLQADLRGAPTAASPGCRGHRARAPPAHPRRPRGPARRRGRRVADLRRDDADSGRRTPSWASAQWTSATRFPTATWACTAGST